MPAGALGAPAVLIQGDMMLSPEQLLDRCNEIRRAGGAEELTALIPGVPGDSCRCLIAVNVNFDCRIDRFTLRTHDPRLDKVAAGLGWERISVHAFRLPRDLSDSVHAFDRYLYPRELYVRHELPT